MWYNKKYGTYRPTTKEAKDKMKKYKKYHKRKCETSKTENWFWFGYLKPFMEKTWLKFVRQKLFWTRIYDFWCGHLWVAIEVDWWYHEEAWKKDKDARYDKYNKEVSWIIVYRIKNYDSSAAKSVLSKIKELETWAKRRDELWLKINKKDKKQIEKEKIEEEVDKENEWKGFYDFIDEIYYFDKKVIKQNNSKKRRLR